MAILACTNINGAGQEIHALVEDPTGRWQSRRRLLFQVGTGLVTYMDGTAKKTFKPDSVKVVLSFGKQHTEPGAWGHALTNAQALTKKWLQMRAKVDFLDVRQPIRKADVQDMLQVIVVVPMLSWTQILRSSGVGGVFARPFVETNQDKLAHRDVPLPAGTTLSAAIRQAQFLGEKAFGVVPYAAGLAVV